MRGTPALRCLAVGVRGDALPLPLLLVGVEALVTDAAEENAETDDRRLLMTDDVRRDVIVLLLLLLSIARSRRSIAAMMNARAAHQVLRSVMMYLAILTMNTVWWMAIFEQRATCVNLQCKAALLLFRH